MKKLYFVLILFVMLFPQLNAQIFYNIGMPPSYQKSEITDVGNLYSINYVVDPQGNLLRENLSTNVKDYIKIEKISDKNIARVKFVVSAKSLGEMTLRFSNVKLKNEAHCYIYTSDYDIVAGPIYEKSISNALNIVKIPAYELILEIIFDNINDFELILNSISYQSLIDISKKRNNSLQGAISDSVWNCANCNYGDINFVDNVGNSCNAYGASLLGAGYGYELFKHPNLYSVNDLKLEVARASCLIMIPTEGGHYQESVPGTLINFPGSDCKGIVIGAYHVGQVSTICDYQSELNIDLIDSTHLTDSVEQSFKNYLDNTIIRFNWHHKYGKPLHLTFCNSSNFALWRKTIDFDEVIDYCGVKGFASSNNGNGDYAIIKMQQMPFYKELHLGWSTQKNFELDTNEPGKVLKYPERFMILGHHAATPTYIFKNSGACIYPNITSQVVGIDMSLINPSEDAVVFEGFSGSQLLYLPDYPNSNPNNNKWIGVGLMKQYSNIQGYNIRSRNYSYSFVTYEHGFNPSIYTVIVDPDLPIEKRGWDTNLYTGYLREHRDELTFRNDFYWMPSVENREKCPSSIGTSNDKCDFQIDSLIKIDYINGKMVVRINIGRINQNNFPGNIYPKGIRIFHDTSDQNTFYFDSFADNENIDSLIKFIIEPCDLFYYQIMGYASLKIGIDFYDEFGKILNYTDCDVRVTMPLTQLDLCDAINITPYRVAGPPEDSCCTFRVDIFFDGCDDCSNIIRSMLEVLRIKDLNTNFETLITNQENLNIDYVNGVISFDIPDICNPTSYKLLALFAGLKNCESNTFELLCSVPLPPIDCCKLYDLNLVEIYELLIDSGSTVLHPQSHTFAIYFTKYGRIVYPSDCFLEEFESANISRSNISGPPSLIAQISTNDQLWPVDNYGTFEGLPPGTYCFYAEIFTTHGICRDTLCIDYDGTYWTVTADSPDPIIEINLNNNTNPNCPLTTQLDYEQMFITDINGKVILESGPIDKIDVSNMTTGTYYILYRKKDKVINSQKLIIKK